MSIWPDVSATSYEYSLAIMEAIAERMHVINYVRGWPSQLRVPTISSPYSYGFCKFVQESIIDLSNYFFNFNAPIETLDSWLIYTENVDYHRYLTNTKNEDYNISILPAQHSAPFEFLTFLERCKNWLKIMTHIDSGNKWHTLNYPLPFTLFTVEQFITGRSKPIESYEPHESLADAEDMAVDVAVINDIHTTNRYIGGSWQTVGKGEWGGGGGEPIYIRDKWEASFNQDAKVSMTNKSVFSFELKVFAYRNTGIGENGLETFSSFGKGLSEGMNIIGTVAPEQKINVLGDGVGRPEWPTGLEIPHIFGESDISHQMGFHAISILNFGVTGGFKYY